MRAARVAVERIDLETASRRASAHGRGRRDPVRAAARLLAARIARVGAGVWAALGEELDAAGLSLRGGGAAPGRGSTSPTCGGAVTNCSRPRSTTPERQPDFGPARIGRAGAIAVGARAPLIAFNAFLDTDDVSIAQAIALAIRASGGGLPYLKALGLLVDGQRAGLDERDRLPPDLAVRRSWQRAARRNGRSTASPSPQTELVGLIPQAALFDYALAGLQLPPSDARPSLGTALRRGDRRLS